MRVDDRGDVMTMCMKLNSSELERFEHYVDQLSSVFPRAGQALRFRAYLRGLLEPTDRKNVEAIATAVAAVMEIPVNLPQSLQHFISQSPWDHRRLFAEVRRLSVHTRDDAHAHWIVHDGVFLKRGHHSVGAHRQFARQVGKKMNCQLGIFVSQVGPKGTYPLAAQLYLPASWLREHPQLSEKVLPANLREPSTKVAIALALIDELLAEGEPSRPVSAEAGYLAIDEFRADVEKRELVVDDQVPELVAQAGQGFHFMKSRLGIDHFEGRTWMGWHHHVSMVVAAYHYLVSQHRGASSITFPAS